ncbi:MAG: major royal jelly [Lasallia pustulata]|uniref:Major royal jelly n=1 Tax=Lasallia pustulata TaxID=136370 RepID=A0A5M8PMG5_9LECA|nr:MAG: major royal jelly [Lasallia pustulata]
MKSSYTLTGLTAFASAISSQVTFQNSSSTILRVDNGSYAPYGPIEEAHYYYDQWPIGLAAAADGRIFVCYTRGTDPYTLAVTVNATAEVAYPSQVSNLPVSQLNTTFNGIPFGSANSSAFISVQALYITTATASRPETLWVLDTGRPTIQDAQGAPTMPYAQPGGPKLVAINVANNSIYQTYTFPPSVHYPDSYMNDVRLDLRNYSEVPFSSGSGVAYINDSSNEGRNGFIVIDLGTGDSWRRLTQDPSVLRAPNNVPSYQGLPFYLKQVGQPIGWQPEGLDGIQLSKDGKTMYYSPLTSDYLYSVPTYSLLVRPQDPLAEIAAHNNVSNLGQRGGQANGFEGDSNGLIYMSMPEQNSINIYNPATLQAELFVRDPRIIWADSLSIGGDGYMYMNINQLPYQAQWNNGTDLRTKPGAVLRCRLPNNGTKLTALYVV